MLGQKRHHLGSLEKDIFQKGSTTYYWSSKFFPTAVREDVFKLYSFVRIADDYVDQVPAQADKFRALRKAWDQAKTNMQFDTVRRPRDTIDERVVKNIVDVIRNYDCDPTWIDSFLNSMQADLDTKQYLSIDDTLGYIYGSAEVIGLIMAKIMGLPDEASHAARMQGRSMQFINFLRDIEEDNALGRRYFPTEDLKRFNLPNLTKKTAHSQPKDFQNFMQFELERYTSWQAEADSGMHYIPKRLHLPLQTAVDMYNWTASIISNTPLIIFDKKVKPSPLRVITGAIKNL